MALCLPREDCELACTAARAQGVPCHSIDMHRFLPRCYLNTGPSLRASKEDAEADCDKQPAEDYDLVWFDADLGDVASEQNSYLSQSGTPGVAPGFGSRYGLRVHSGVDYVTDQGVEYQAGSVDPHTWHGRGDATDSTVKLPMLTGVKREVCEVAMAVPGVHGFLWKPYRQSADAQARQGLGDCVSRGRGEGGQGVSGACRCQY